MAEKKKPPRRNYGSGGISQRTDGRYEGSFYVDGKRKSVYGKTKAEVKQKLADAQKQAEAGTLVPVDRQTVGEYLEEWLATRKHTWRPLTYQNHCYHVKNHLTPALGKMKVQKIERRQVQAFVNSLTDKKGLAASTVAEIYATLRLAYKDAMRQGLVGISPCTDIHLPRVEERENAVLTAEQAQHLLHAVKGHKHEGIVTVALATALRRGELLALEWKDVDLEAGTLTVKHGQTYVYGEGFHKGPPKSKSGRRTITLVPFAIEALKEHRKQQRKQQLRSSAWIDKGLVFPNEFGGEKNPWVLDHEFAQLMTTTGLPPMRLHDLRHSCATLLISKGVSPKVVQEILGHATVDITLRKYGNVIPGMHESAMQLYQGLLAPEKKAHSG